jgi:hypothetical protein
VTTVRLRYTVRKRGNLFWQPTPEMKALGFLPKALGPDGPEAQALALKLAGEWDQARAEQGKVTDYPAGTFGAFYDRFKRTTVWAKKGPRTREDYDRAWKHIDAWRPAAGKPTLSRTVITQLTTELCEQFADHLETTLSPNERHRTIKWLKVLLADAAVRLRLGYASPAAKLKNPQPKGRTAIWLGAQVEDMAAGAAIAGFEGMSLAIETAWETMFSPVDVRTLRPRQIKRDAGGWYATGHRGKTRVEFFAALSDDLAGRLLAYIERQGRAEADDTPIFRQRDGLPYRNKDTFAGDFRDVRSFMFPGDTRQLLDIRRSANVEADAAGADKKTMGELLANGLADSRFLEETYTPPTVAKARDVAAQRIQGRAKLAGEVLRARNT